MSKLALKRWLDARDAYLGHQVPYIQQRLKPYRRRRRRRHRTRQGVVSITDDDERIIDDHDDVSSLTIESDRFSEQKTSLNERPFQSSQSNDSITRFDQAKTSARHSGCFERMKSFVTSPVRSLSHLSIRRRTAQQQQQNKTQMIYDHFDDKCVGREVDDRLVVVRANLQYRDESTQVDIARPSIQLYHEYDIGMVDGEKQQRMRSARYYVESSDKTTETDFIVNLINDEQDRGEIKRNTDKASCPRRDEEKDNEQPTLINSQSTNSLKHKHRSNRILPWKNYLPTSIKHAREHKDEYRHGSRTSIVSPTESTMSVHEQLQR
jgi:hypothetical protein